MNDGEDGEARTWREESQSFRGADQTLAEHISAVGAAVPGTAVTSLSRVKSSSRVGGWCWRGQFETAAVSCSSNKTHTWIRPGRRKTRLEPAGSGDYRRRNTRGPPPVSSSNSCRTQSIPSSVLMERSCVLLGRLASRAPRNTGFDGIL